MNSAIDLKPEHREITSAILRAWAPGRKVLVFGSRAKGKAKPASDLDICLMGDEVLPRDLRTRLAAAFDEAPLPFKVDIVEWAVLEDNFRKVVSADGIEWIG